MSNTRYDQSQQSFHLDIESFRHDHADLKTLKKEFNQAAQTAKRVISSLFAKSASQPAAADSTATPPTLQKNFWGPL